MTTINVVHTARKRRTCDTGSRDCAGTIEPGQRYRRSSLTPNDPEVSNRGWWHANECAPCAALYGRPLPEVTS